MLEKKEPEPESLEKQQQAAGATKRFTGSPATGQYISILCFSHFLSGFTSIFLVRFLIKRLFFVSFNIFSDHLHIYKINIYCWLPHYLCQFPLFAKFLCSVSFYICSVSFQIFSVSFHIFSFSFHFFLNSYFLFLSGNIQQTCGTQQKVLIKKNGN